MLAIGLRACKYIRCTYSEIIRTGLIMSEFVYWLVDWLVNQDLKIPLFYGF